jgi:hypothetical protein
MVRWLHFKMGTEGISPPHLSLTTLTLTTLTITITITIIPPTLVYVPIGTHASLPIQQSSNPVVFALRPSPFAFCPSLERALYIGRMSMESY